MARPKILIGLLALATLLVALPARAQLFDSIFGNRPPRPPADVPNAPPSRAEPPYYPSYPDRDARPRSDEPPPVPQPPPMSLPPQARPGGGAVQSEPLAPIPGTEPRRQVTVPPPNAPPPGQLRPGVAPPAASIPPQPGDQIVVEPPAQRITNPSAVFAGLDKITGRIISFDVAINETVQFGALQVTPRVCYSRPPTESPQTDSFVEVDEVTLQGEIKRIFTGWMFAASPGLHAIEHPIYDVWLAECKGGKNPAVAEAPPQAEPPKPAARPVPQPRRPPAPRGTLPGVR
jgi:hypothetical protein